MSEPQTTRSDTIAVENDDGSVTEYHWPFCRIEGCGNRECRSLGSPYCYPHTIGFEPSEWLKLQKEKENV